MGTVGNLQFGLQDGGTTRFSPPGALASVSNSWVARQFRRHRAPQLIQERRDFFRQAYQNSGLIGNALGRLAQGNLANLPGALDSLSSYMNELTLADLEALRNGMLGHPTVRDAVLETISPAVRAQAARVVEQIATALDRRLARDIVQPHLKRIRKLMRRQRVDGKALAVQLSSLATVLAAPVSSRSQRGLPVLPILDTYFQSLPQSRVNKLAFVFGSVILRPAQEALQRMDDDLAKRRALAMLNIIHGSLEREICARVQPSLQEFKVALDQARHDRNPRAASRIFCELNTLVGASRQAYGWLPETVDRAVRKLVDDNLILFRDATHNPSGALNAASLSRLDEVTVANLRNVRHLRGFGLELEAAARTGWGQL
ncbi:hypothetical protein [Alcaligenes sp. Marseille-Q7550]